jgi:light-regulated signal transduction histidine kinase (bacteriophytochrome)
MRTQRVPLTALVAEVQQELAARLQNRTVNWVIGPLPTVDGDPGLLRIVLMNLLSNAVKFTAPRSEARIEVGTTTGEPGEVVIFVRDNGVGFDMHYVSKLFGLFQRLHAAEQFEGTGTGTGLATVRRIIHRHGGRVWAEGEVEGGATVSVSTESGRPRAFIAFRLLLPTSGNCH